MGLPDKVYDRTDLERAKTKGQVIGWLQGGAAVLVGAMFLKFVGWIPALAILGIVGYVVYKLLSKTGEG